jgi:2-dehydro-3-deoxyphosphogluconate aldolase/(4S)-4-hydroxy-2-oxoglutarate aldolase
LTQSRREEIVAEIGARRISAIIRTHDARLAADAMSAVVAGGFRMIEFTLTTPDAVQLIAEFSRDPALLVGAGTVLSTDQAEAAVGAGARFLVSPVTDRAVIEKARELDVASIPGTFTPTEMLEADRCGADLVKVFPAPADIPRYVTQIRGPLPWLRIFPTAGVDPGNFLDVLRAGAYGVGFVSSLFDPEDMRARDLGRLERRAAEIIRAFRSAELPPPAGAGP